MAAAAQDFGQQASALRSEHVSGAQGMAERGEVGRSLQQFDAYEHAALRKHDRFRGSESPERHMRGGIRRIRLASGARVPPGATVKQNAAPKACAVRNNAPTLADLETPS